jgi:hypothetical protein
MKPGPTAKAFRWAGLEEFWPLDNDLADGTIIGNIDVVDGCVH